MRGQWAIAFLCFVGLFPAIGRGQSSVTELNDAAWKALQNDDSARAARLFGEALTLRPDDPILLLGAGAAAHAEGKQTDAMARLTRALELEPRLTAASKLLGGLAYQEGDIDVAIRTYERALTYAPTDAELVKALNAWRREAELHHGFEERRYDRFRVMFEGPAEESLATQATAALNAAFWRIGGALGEYPSASITTVLYTDQQFRDITRAPEWSGGEYDGRIRVPVVGASQQPALFERVLTHELTHAIVASIAPRGVPTWLSEGLAQHFDGTDLQAARLRVQLLGRFVPLEQLEQTFAHLSARDAQVAYDESALAVGVMFDRPGFGWARLLHALAGGERFDRVMDSFGFSYADLDAEFRTMSQPRQ